MTDREKVIKGLECCMVGDGNDPDCEICPYATVGDDTCQTMDELFSDALELLKAQEPVEPQHLHDKSRLPLKCGNCGAFIIIIGGFCGDYKAKFCCECGRPVKWE